MDGRVEREKPVCLFVDSIADGQEIRALQK